MTANKQTENHPDRRHASSRTRQDSPARILLAEDDPEMRRMLAWTLSAEGYDVTECGNGPTALAHLSVLEEDNIEDRPRSFDLFLSDIRLPGLTALEVLEFLGRDATPPPVILITAFGDHRVHCTAERLGAAALLDKPFELEELVATVRRVLHQSSSQPSTHTTEICHTEHH